MKTSEVLDIVKKRVDIENVLTIYLAHQNIKYVCLDGNNIIIHDMQVRDEYQKSLGYYHMWSNPKYKTNREFIVSYDQIRDVICYKNYIIDTRASTFIIHKLDEIEEIFINNNLKILENL